MIRNTWLARSTAPTSNVVASLMRRPHAYMTARHVLWTGLRMPPRRCRTCSSDSASGSRFCRGEAILFFPEQPPGTVERVVVEEAKAVLTGLEGAACHALLAQAEQVTPHLFLAELIGRAAVMRGQPAYCLDVDLPRSLSQPGQGHILDHPRT